MKYSTAMSIKKKQKFYVVWKGHEIGIFSTWECCEAQVKGFPGAEYKSFDSLIEAEQAFERKYEYYLRQQFHKLKPTEFGTQGHPIIPSYCVDASCIGNPGILEYHCVETDTREEIFAEGPFQQGTNNVGEFLAIVQSLSFFQKKGITAPIYTDSRNAINWVYKKKCRTRLIQDIRNVSLFVLIENAEMWLQNNSYQNLILKWHTKKWGENPADYGRK